MTCKTVPELLIIIYFLIMQEDLQMTVKGGRHQLTGVVSLGGYYDDLCKIKAAGTVLQQ